MNVWGQNCYVFSGENLLEVFSPIWSHVNENEKKIWQKVQNLKFRQSLYNFGTDPP